MMESEDQREYIQTILGEGAKKEGKKLTNVSFMYVCVAGNGEMLVFFFLSSFFPPTIVFRIFRSSSYLGTMCFSLPFIPNNQLISAQMESTWILTCALF